MWAGPRRVERYRKNACGVILCLMNYTIYVRFIVPPLFIVPPPREREHVPRGPVPPSRLQDGGNSRNMEVRTEVRPNATLL